MRVVLDPNVIVSAALSASGAPALLIRRWLAGEFELLISPALLDELRRVLAYPKISSRIGPDDAAALMDLLEAEGETVPDPTERSGLPVEDPDDESLLSLAAAHGAALISGDKHLMALSDELPIYRPADFVKALDEAPLNR